MLEEKMAYLLSGLKVQKRRVHVLSLQKFLVPELNNFRYNIWCTVITTQHFVGFSVIDK